MPPLGVLVYDADCGFCVWALTQGRRMLSRMPVALSGREADLPALGLSPAQAARAVWLVDPLGRRWSGHRAIAQVLRGQPELGRRVLGAVLTMPPVSWLAALSYRWVAGHRRLLPGASPACAA